MMDRERKTKNNGAKARRNKGAKNNGAAEQAGTGTAYHAQTPSRGKDWVVGEKPLFIRRGQAVIMFSA
jgi:hypothetical protein